MTDVGYLGGGCGRFVSVAAAPLYFFNLCKSLLVILLHLAGPPVPIMARTHSTPQRLRGGGGPAAVCARACRAELRAAAAVAAPRGPIGGEPRLAARLPRRAARARPRQCAPHTSPPRPPLRRPRLPRRRHPRP
eukprot:3301353-Pyramimonas_sp.AAC.2